MSTKSYFKSYNNLTMEQLLMMRFMPNTSNKSLQPHSLEDNKALKTVIKADNYCSFILLYSRTMGKLSGGKYLVCYNLIHYLKSQHIADERYSSYVHLSSRRRQICQSDLLIWLPSLSQPNLLESEFILMASWTSNAFIQVENWSKDVWSQNTKPEKKRAYVFIFPFWHSTLCTISDKLKSLLVLW